MKFDHGSNNCQDDTDSSYCFILFKGFAPLIKPALLTPFVGVESRKEVMQAEYQLKLELTVLPRSLNKKLQWQSKFKNGKENKAWDSIIYSLVRNKLPLSPLTKAKIKIVRHSHRMLDFDGCVGSMKSIIDSLVTCGVLLDDRWGVTGQWDVDQQFRPKKNGPLLEILITSCV